MNKLYTFLIPILILLFSWNAYAQDSTSNTNVPILKGEVSPIDGFVVPELTLFMYMELEIDNEELKGKLESQKKFCNGVETTCDGAMEELAAPTKWYQTNRFHRIFGFTLGVVVTIAGGIVVVKIVD